MFKISELDWDDEDEYDGINLLPNKSNILILNINLSPLSNII